jgi:FkbM family methyltransferase
MSAQLRRAWHDVRSVSRHAAPAAAARWGTGLLLHLPECARTRSLRPADQTWAAAGGTFRAPGGTLVRLPGAYTAGAREMYCRNVYLRTGLVMPSAGWVVDLGANCGLFTVWAARNGATALAVEAQAGFAGQIRQLAEHNGVARRVHVETAIAGGVATAGSAVGDLADDGAWAATSHGERDRPAETSVPALMARYGIDRIGLLKVDIEGGEFAVLSAGEDLAWLSRVDQLAIELHGAHGDTGALTARLRGQGFTADIRDDWGDRADPAAPAAAYGYFRRGRPGPAAR